MSGPLEQIGVAELVGGGLVAALVGWFRERRKARRDAGAFALELIEAQAKRIDTLMLEVGRLQSRVEQLLSENAALRLEVDRLREASEA